MSEQDRPDLIATPPARARLVGPFRRRWWLLGAPLLLLGITLAWTTIGASPSTATNTADTQAAQGYTCPMHPDVHSATPGQCPKCGMNLVPEASGTTSGTTSGAAVAVDAAYQCPMHPEVTSDAPGRCPRCGMPLEKVAPAQHDHTATSSSSSSSSPSSPTQPLGGVAVSTTASAASATPMATPSKTPPGSADHAHEEAMAMDTTGAVTPMAGDDEVAWYTCSMHPTVKQQVPGNCPICGMTLTPVTKGELRTGVVTVDAVRRQRFGIRTAPVLRETVSKPIRALGKVVLDERRIVDVSVQTHGWIEGLQVRETGQFVKQGQTLAWLYSPVVVAAQDELQLDLKAKAEALSTSSAGLNRQEAFIRGARGKLRSLGLADWQIDEVAAASDNPRRFGIVAPTSGYVVSKDVVEGAHVADGSRLFRLVPLDRVWVDAEVYARDLPLVEMGQVATARLPGGATQQGNIDWIYPEVSPRTQTARVRVELPNKSLALRPGMYVDVDVLVELGERLMVPTEAVIYAGRHRLVFVDRGEGALVPVTVTVGVTSGDRVEVTSGLSAGETVVTSGVFLVAAESRLKSGAGAWGGATASDPADVAHDAPTNEGHGGHQHGQH